MKTFRTSNSKIVVVCISILFALTACEKDKDDSNSNTEPNSFFTYNGNTYLTPNALAVNEGEVADDTTEYVLNIYSSTFKIENIDDELVYSGSGEVISFFLEAPVTDLNLPVGDFVLSDDEVSYTYYGVEILLGTNYDSEDDGEYLDGDGDGGSVKITKNGDIYTIEYTFQLTNGKELKGSYTGSIETEIDVII